MLERLVLEMCWYRNALFCESPCLKKEETSLDSISIKSTQAGQSLIGATKYWWNTFVIEQDTYTITNPMIKVISMYCMISLIGSL